MSADSDTPVMAFLSRLLSRGLSHAVAMEEATVFEATLRNATTASTPDETKRQKERDRKAAQRARRLKSPMGQGSVGISSSDLDSVDRDSGEERKSKNSDVPRDTTASRSKGTRIHDDWQPAEHDVQYGVDVVKLLRSEIADCAAEMKLWAQANANRAIARKACWSLTFKGWMRRAAPQIIRNRPRGPGGGGDGKTQGAGARVGFSGLAARLRRSVEASYAELSIGDESAADPER